MAEEQLDLLQTLFRDWAAEQLAEPATILQELATVKKFMERARAMLGENQPVSMEYVDSGFAIRFQDNSVIPFITGAESNTTGGTPGEIPVTKPGIKKGHGPVPSQSWGITTDDK